MGKVSNSVLFVGSTEYDARVCIMYAILQPSLPSCLHIFLLPSGGEASNRDV